MNRPTLTQLKRIGIVTVSALALGASVSSCAKRTILGAPDVPPPVTRPQAAPQHSMERAEHNTKTFAFEMPTAGQQQAVVAPTYTHDSTPASATVAVPNLVVDSPSNHQEPVTIGERNTVMATTPAVRESFSAEAVPQTVVHVEPMSYTVKKGDNLWTVGRMYGVSMQEIASYNNRDVEATLAIGTVLQLPPGASFVPENQRPPIQRTEPRRSPAPTPAPAPARNTASTRQVAASKPLPTDGKYTVQRGDTLSEIAQMFGLSVKSIMDQNNLKDTTIFPRQTLVIGKATGGTTTASAPGNAPPPVIDDAGALDIPAPNLPNTVVPAIQRSIVEEPARATAQPANTKVFPHWCDKADTLAGIAEMYDSEVEWILKANPGLTRDTPLEGRKIDVPVANNE